MSDRAEKSWARWWSVALLGGAALVAGKCGGDVRSAQPDAIATVSRGNISQTVHLTGTVRPQSVTEVQSPIAGRLVDIVVKEGDTVASGDVVASLVPEQEQALLVAEAREAVTVRAAQLRVAAAEMRRAERLEREGVISREMLENARMAYDSALSGKRLADARLETVFEQGAPNGLVRDGILAVVAPVSGDVLTVNAAPGDSIRSGTRNVTGAGTTVLRIADNSRMFVRSEVSEIDVGGIRRGTRATIRPRAFPGMRLSGVVNRVASEGRVADNRATFTMDVAIQGSPPLRAGMTCDVDVAVAERVNVLLLPVVALEIVNGKPSVMMVGASTATAVETGLSDGERIEIVSGLRQGDRVATMPVAR